MIKVGIVGMGVIGTHIAKAITNGIPGIALAGVSVRTRTTAGAFPVFALAELIHRSDLVVEAATQAALTEFRPAVIEAGKHLMVVSVGAPLRGLAQGARVPPAPRCPL